MDNLRCYYFQNKPLLFDILSYFLVFIRLVHPAFFMLLFFHNKLNDDYIDQ
jgi:hypothetical protein